MRDKLIEAIDFAIKTGSFSVINACKNAKNVCAFGLGKFFEKAFDQWKYKEILGVNVLCDNDTAKWGNTFKGLPCVSPEELVKLDDLIVIPLVGYKNSQLIFEQMYNAGIRCIYPDSYALEYISNTPQSVKWFAQNRIMDVYDMLADDESRRIYASVLCNRIAFGRFKWSELYSTGEYFPDFFELHNDEVFVDCGAYTGDTLIRFINACLSPTVKFAEIHAFEVDAQNFAELGKVVSSFCKEQKINNIYCYRAAVWNETCSLSFGREEHGPYESVSVNKTGDSFITQTVPAVKIDDIAPNATFIKMDIEGAELNALKGAENTIKNNAPKLAVCLYHQLSDFWEIPMYLKDIMPEYSLYIRHHVKQPEGTVLYACI